MYHHFLICMKISGGASVIYKNVRQKTWGVQGNIYLTHPEKNWKFKFASHIYVYEQEELFIEINNSTL